MRFLLFNLLVFLAGSLSVLSQAPLNIFFILLITLPVLFYVLDQSLTENSFSYKFLKITYFGSIFLYGYFFFGLSWISSAFDYREGFEELKFISIFPPSFVEKKNLKKKNIFNNKPFIIGTVCRLSREKGLSEFLITIAKLKLKLKFIIIGDGPEENKLKKLSIKLGIKKNIIFQGFLNYKEIKQKLKTFDIYINCSHFEGFPNSVVESLSNGIPVLASQSHGGINDIINNKKFGYIYKNEKDLMKILLNIYNKKKTFKLNKRETIAHLKNFSLSKSIKQYSKVFENI